MEPIVEQLDCLINAKSSCDWGGLGGATPFWVSALAVFLPVLLSLVAGLWLDFIKDLIKASFSNLFFATIGIVITVIQFAIVGLVLALCFCFLIIPLRKKIWGHQIATPLGNAPLPKLIAPTLLVVYCVGLGAQSVWQSFQPPGPTIQKDLIAFVKPTELINAGFNDPLYENRHDVLFDLDFAPHKLLAAPFSDISVRFAPDLDPQGYPSFRKDFGNIGFEDLDYFLEQNESLKHLRDNVGIAFEATITIEDDGNDVRYLILRAHLRKRDTDNNKFLKDHAGDPLVVFSTEKTLNQSILVMTAQLAAKMMDALDEPRMTPAVEQRIWRGLSSALYDGIDKISSPTVSQRDEATLEMQSVAQTCEARDCVLMIADFLEDRTRLSSAQPSQVETADFRLRGAYGP